ncbi:hypothetical protein KS2013_1480 [Kangiella sediminilitoris]|uniref:Uncharacterized protein n=1 Tax=Kangiella sediminilitoris TaxID=1144748 RepID=A0A1B3BBM8_9GAMM|nr:hypothetical protein KS2013_1480 [Kangiella sediminilitoris]
MDDEPIKLIDPWQLDGRMVILTQVLANLFFSGAYLGINE